MREYQTCTLQWEGLSIEVLYCPSWAESYCVTYGYPLAHLQIKAANREKLSISDTGHKSHFERADNIEAEGGPAAYVLAWLNHAAQSRQWKEAQEEARQLSFFPA
jgi:hypothetical protein